MARKDTLELIQTAMFNPTAERKLSVADQALLTRMKDGYTYWLDHPQLSDTQIREYLICIHKISKTQAINDLSILIVLLGNVNNACKEFYRYKVNDLLSKATAAAEVGLEKKAKALAKIADVMVRNNRTDVDDGEKLPWDEFIIPDFSFSTDPSIVGVTLSPGAIKQARILKARIDKEYSITEVEYEPVEEVSE